MRNPIVDIIRYLRNLDPADDLKLAFIEEQKDLKRYRRMQKRLPHLIRELESIVSKLRELTD